MKKIVNGIVYEMTESEIEEMNRLAAEMPKPDQTPEERITELEEALALLLSGVTE